MLNLNYSISVIKYLCAYQSVAGFLLLPNSFELFLATIKQENTMRCSIYSHTSVCDHGVTMSAAGKKHSAIQQISYVLECLLFYIFILVAAVYFHHDTENKGCASLLHCLMYNLCQKIKLWAILSTENDKDWMIYKNYIRKHIYLIS